MLTGKRARWDELRVWGCDAFHLIPNDPLAKVPGIVKGRKVIFVGFTPGCNGYRVFDPESRKYSTVGNFTFTKVSSTGLMPFVIMIRDALL